MHRRRQCCGSETRDEFPPFHSDHSAGRWKDSTYRDSVRM
jgi:hypothetical protein